MTLRDSSVRYGNRKSGRGPSGRLRDKRRRKDRQLLNEKLEQRQLLAGPDLVGIQPNEGALISGGEILNVSPRELIFRFDDQSDIDPLTIQSGISITRAGADRGFESATGTTDMGTGGAVLLEFRAAESGARGNGIEVRLRSSDRGTGSQVVLVSVNQADRIITLDLNSNPGRPSVVSDVIFAVQNDQAAAALVEVDQISGPSLFPVGPTVGSGIDVILAGANAAQFVSDLGTGGQERARFISTVSGTAGVGTTISVSRSNLNLSPGQLPFVSVSGQNIQVILDSAPGNESTVGDLIAAINSDPDAAAQVFAQLEIGTGQTVVSNTSFSPMVLVGATDTVVEPGFIGLGDTPHEVVFRFAETLPEDTYQVEIFGSGPFALRDVDGEAFADGTDFGRQFTVNTAPQVAAVVPTPVRRDSNGVVSPELNIIDVYFDEPVTHADDPMLYDLVYTRDTVSNRDDVVIQPNSVSYDPVTRVARLEFLSPLSRFRDPLDPTRFLSGSARLLIGTDRAIPDAPANVNVNVEPGDAFSDAFQLDATLLNSEAGAIESLVLSGQIDNPDEYGLAFPGGSEVPGVRNVRPDDPSRVDRTIPLDVWRVDGDIEDGISTIFYDFKGQWRGDDPNRGLETEPDLDQTYFNLITDEQKQRVREVLSLYSEYLGVQFVETDGVPLDDTGQPLDGRFFSIAVGELTGAGTSPPENSEVGGVTVATRPLDQFGNTFLHNEADPDDPDPANPLNSGNQLLVMDFQDFDESIDDQLGGEFFSGAFLGVGQLLGYGYADHLPQPVTQATQSVLNPAEDNEPLFPSPSDIVNGQYLFRPESNDVDLYRFSLTRPGAINIQTAAERLRSASSLDTALRLYQNLGTDSRGNPLWQEIAANDDYFSNDSLIELNLAAGDYIVGVSASGNTRYDPTISGTGIGGLTEGTYELRVTFQADGVRSIVDSTQIPLDGDLDGRPGGEFNFWFVPSDPVDTLYVDKAFTGVRSGPVGIASNPYSDIDDAIRDAEAQIAAQTGDLVKKQVRIVGGGRYEIGLDDRALPLDDGATLDLPRGVQLVIDAGSTFLMRRSRIGIGSTTEAELADRSETSIQVLGVPGNPVVFTSQSPSPRAGDWGGIDIRGDIDTADDSRVNLEDAGVFLNHIQYADIRFGGGPVAVDGNQVTVSPIEMAVTRATVINSRITDSADAAIAATPDTFAETRFDEERFQRDGQFTPDVRRAGPHIRGNEIVDNTINGLFIRVETRTGDDLEALQVVARIDDTDVVHVLTENLLIEGNPGGPNAGLAPPSVLLVRAANTSEAGSLAPGNYQYRLTFVNRDGYETSASDATGVFAAGSNGAIRLTGLPTVPADLGFTGRRLYRASVDAVGNVGPFLQVARLNTNDTTFVDTAAGGTTAIVPENVRIGRLDPSLRIDPGSVLKMRGSRIDVTLGAHLYAEGTEAEPIVLTSLSDNRFGAGGSFDTSSTGQQDSTLNPGDWGGVYVAFGGEGSLDHVTVAGGGGSTRLEGGFGSFNTIEVHQGELRVANSRFEDNSDGRSFVNDEDDVRDGRVGRGDNAGGTIFVRGSQPVIVDNVFVDGSGPILSFDVNSFTAAEEVDYGRNTGLLDARDMHGNSGPMIDNNRVGTTRLNQLDPSDPENLNFSCADPLGENPIFDQNGDLIACSLNGLEIRGGTVATEVVLDDVDMVHIVRDTIEVPNQHVFGGMRLQSDARGSLVVKFQNQDNDLEDTIQRRQAGIVVGGNLVTSEDQFIDIDDRIGGSLQIVGHPDFPVVLTALVDDTSGAGFTQDGRQNVDTDNNGTRLDENGDPIFVLTADTDSGPPPPPLLPLGMQYDRTDLEEIDNANLIDNDIDPQVIGFLEAEIEYGGQIEDNVRFTYLNNNPADGAIGPLQLANVEFLYTTYIDVDTFSIFVDPAPMRLIDLGVQAVPVLIGPDRVRSSGSFVLDSGTIVPANNPNPRRVVDWVAESFILNSRGMIYTQISFATQDGSAFTDGVVNNVRVISYLDQGIDADADDVLYSVGTPGQADFRAYTINRDGGNRTLGPLIGFSHGGIYTNDSFNQFNADYQGWIADDATQLLNAIELETRGATFTVAGNVDTTTLPPSGDPLFDAVTPGTVARGLADIGTAFAWDLEAGEDDARVTTFVEFFPSDPADPFLPALPAAIDGAGTWDGVTIREAASDANVAITSENEPSNLGNILANDTNPIPSQAQFLGELAPSPTGGDNARRLGFIVDGTIAQPGDLDVYSFIGEAGTQIWLDIDRTNSSLDTVVELIDTNGFVRLLSDDSLAEARGDSNRLVGPGGFDASTARPLGTTLVPAGSPDSAYQDLYSTNPRDAGMRLVLPGNVGQRFLYHVRVRSANSPDASAASLVDPNQVRDGLTTGAYQLQVRLEEADVFAGTQVRYSDVRFAVNGVQVIGGPNHSPILGEEYETASPNDTIGDAQRLGLYETLYDDLTVNAAGQVLNPATGLPITGLTVGLDDALIYDRNTGRNNGDDVTLQNPAGPLTSDRLAKSIGGILDGASDVDWYQFDIGYEQISRDSAALHLSTIFDLDYGDGVARADTAIYVFNEERELVLVGTDSNVADDQPPGQPDTSDLSRGSFGTGDPFIGAAELSEGTYYVAVANEDRVPVQLSQFFDPNTDNPLLRLEPVDSIVRIAEDRIYRDSPDGPIEDSGNYDVNGDLITFAGGNVVDEDGFLRDRTTGELLLVNGQPRAAGGGTASPPEVPVLFDGESILEYSFDDVLLYVNTATGLEIVNPFTGAQYIPNGNLGNFGDVITDVAFRSNGELFGFSSFNGRPQNDTNYFYHRIDTGDATLSPALNTGPIVNTFEAVRNVDPMTGVVTIQVVPADVGLDVEAITIANLAGGGESGFFVGNRTTPLSTDAILSGARYDNNILYEFGTTTGLTAGPTVVFNNALSGAATSPREVGKINTDPADDPNAPLGVVVPEFADVLGLSAPLELDATGVLVPRLVDGDRFTIRDFDPSGQFNRVTFEFNTGITLVASPLGTVADGQSVTVDGLVFEFNTDGQLLRLSDATPISAASTVTVGGANGQQVTVEFVPTPASIPSPDNVAIALTDAFGQTRLAEDLAAELAAVINAAIANVGAREVLGDVFFDGPVQPSLAVTGAGIVIPGDDGVANPTAVSVDVRELARPEEVIAALQAAAQVSSVVASAAGTQIAFPLATSVTSDTPSLGVSGEVGVDSGNVEVFIQPGDSTEEIAERIITAVESAATLVNVTAAQLPGATRSIEIFNGIIEQIGSINDLGEVDFVGPNDAPPRIGGLTIGGIRRAGQVTGAELVGGQNLYAVTDQGELYVVNNGELNSTGPRGVGDLVETATDLIGIPFTGLRSGPISFNNGALRQTLFGITSSGAIYAFNTLGELQPIFAGGQSVIQTGVTGALGLDFGVADFNLWHVTGQRGTDPGHGINALFNDTRLDRPGSSSLAFTYENFVFNGNYPSNVEQPTFSPRLDGTVFEDSYNVPGGAKGVVQSNPFSLEGYASDDLPMLYFNYFMETEAIAGLDALRAYVVTSDGVEHLVSTNNFNLRPGTGDDEFDDPSPIGNPAYADPDDPTLPDDIDTDVQRLFEAADSFVDIDGDGVDDLGPTWRQARVPLGEFAGMSGLSLRIEYSTSGTTLTTSESIRVISGQALAQTSQRELVIGGAAIGDEGETFILDLAPTIVFPSGKQLADLYQNASEVAVITVYGQQYVLNDGTRPVATGQISIDLLGGTAPGTTLADLSADDIAATVDAQIQGANPVVADFNFSDPSDDPAVPTGRNDTLQEATPLPYSGGNLDVTGTGRLGTFDPDDDTVPPTNLDDVDLVSLEVSAGTTVDVDVDLDFATGLDAIIRFFDARGEELFGIADPINRTIAYTAVSSGLLYIGISGLGNGSYDPTIPGSGQTGQVDSYTATVSITTPASAQRVDGNLVEYFGQQGPVSATPSELFGVTQSVGDTAAIAVPVSRFMSEDQIASTVQRAIADRFTFGDTSLIPTSGPSITLSGFNVLDTGPFGDQSDRFTFDGSFAGGTRNNAFEGVYLDDFIIGFAERGEIATDANPLSAVDPADPNDPNDPNVQFIADGSRLLTNPPQPTQPTTRGAYQLEIRDGSEYVNSSLVLVTEPELQFSAGDPVVVPVSGVAFGVPALSVPVSSIVPKEQSPFPEFDLPTIDIALDAANDPVVTQIGQDLFVTLVANGALVQLIELDANFEPAPSTFMPIPAEARFRTFNTNDRLASGFTLEALSGTGLVDGATFTIFDSRNELNFEFDVADSTGVFDGLGDPAAIVIEVTPEDSAAGAASKILDVLNSQSVQAVLELEATRANTSLPATSAGARDFLDPRIHIYGNISFREVTPSFASVTSFDQRGDDNRDRDQQGVILIENSRFLFNSDSGVAIVRDAEARTLSQDQRDEFPVALTYPANLLELNTEGLIPGLVVQNNVLAYNANNGILISGIDGGGGSLNNPVGFDNVVNNTLIGGVVEAGVDLGPQIFSGFLFERGGISFADQVDFDSLNLGSDVDSVFTDAEAALSSPDCAGHGPEPVDGEFTLSLGTEGQATFRFTDNFLTGNNSPTPDLVIFEAGASESVRVEISRDGENFIFVGNVNGLNNTIDIDQFIDPDNLGLGVTSRFGFVRLTDLVSPLDEPTAAFGAAGADIDAVGALSSVPASSFTPGAQGIFVTQNSAPTLLNNIVANFQVGVAVTPPSNNPALNDIDVSQDLTVIGGTTYFRNAFDANGTDEQALGLSAQIVSDFEPIFVDPTTLVFTPQHAVRTIDSSIDSLEERASLSTVRGAVGLPPVPIIAPSFDLNGQFRIDDPNVDTPLGTGLSVFKDRGAEDRADATGPRLSLINPRADDLLIDSGRAFTTGTIFDAFDIQLIDGIVPADPGAGVGVDDGGVDGSLIRVTRLEAGSNVTETLVEGIDYRFAYEPADNTIRLTPIPGIWRDNSTYTIQFLGDEVGILRGQAATSYADGALTQVDLTVQDRRAIEVDTGIGISIAPTALTIDQGFGLVANIEGQTLEVFDGQAAEPVIFELTTDNDNIPIIIDAGNIPVRVGEAATAEQIAAAVATAINESDVKLLAVAVGSRIQLRDSVVKASELFDVQGAAAYLGADVSLSPELRGANIAGQSLAVFDGNVEITFTLITDSSQPTTGTPVLVSPTARTAEIASAIAAAIGGSGLQVSANVLDDVLQLRGLSDRVDPETALSFARSGSLTGNPLNDAFKITNYSLDVLLTDDLLNAVDGSSITIFDGQSEFTFEFDNVPPPAGTPAVVPGNLAVPVGANPTARELITALRERIEATELRVQIVAAARSFRITGTAAPISVSSATGAVTVSGFGAIGTSPGFGIGIPADGMELSDTVDEGQSFVITRGPTTVVFEIDFDGVQEIEGSTLVTSPARTLDAVADAMVAAINASQLGLTAENIDGGRVVLGGLGTENVTLNLTNSVFTQLGIAGLPTPTAVVIPIDATEEEIAAAYSGAFDDLNVTQELIGDRVIVEGLENLGGASVIAERISDEVNNPAFLGELVIFVGGGFDYGDAPSPYASTAAQGGPRHTVDSTFALAPPASDRPVTPDNDAQLPNLDEDNGVAAVGALQPGFNANFEVSVLNEDGRTFFVDAWFDWDADGIFEVSEALRFGSAGTGRSLLGVGTNVISVAVPAGAQVGEIYARFRLSEQANLGPGGDATSGEVEDVRLLVSNNPFQNPTIRHDVNDSDTVTPIDALQIINAIGRNDGNNIFLDAVPLPANLPLFPDVSGDGVVSAIDALQVINELARLPNAIEGESVSYVPTSGGVLASGATALGDALIAEALQSAGQRAQQTVEQDTLAVTPPATKTSVFDSPAVVQLDSLVDALAEDAASEKNDNEEEVSALDQLFASL